MIALVVFPLLLLVLIGGAIACCKLPVTTVVWVAVGFWALYGVYEYLMFTRVLCSGECNIRIDLILIYPALAIVTAAAVRKAIKSRGRIIDH